MRFILCFLLALSSVLAAELPKEKWVDVAGHNRLYCRVLGKGDPLIVIHGGPGLSQQYLYTEMKRLAEHHLVIFYDQRGCGESQGEIESDKIQINTLVDDLDAVRLAFGFKKVSILGHSFGGLLAMQYAIAHPEAVDKLVLLNSAAASSDDFALFVKEVMKRLEPVGKEMQRLKAIKGYQEGDPETVAELFNIIFRTYCYDPQKADLINVKNTARANVRGFQTYEYAEKNFWFQPYDIRGGLRKLNCSTLIVHGDSDPVPLVTAQNTHKNIKNSKLVVLEKCGHFPYVEMPEALFNCLEGFLK